MLDIKKIREETKAVEFSLRKRLGSEIDLGLDKIISLDDERRLELSFEWVRWSDLVLKGEKYRLPYPISAKNANPLLK